MGRQMRTEAACRLIAGACRLIAGAYLVIAAAACGTPEPEATDAPVAADAPEGTAESATAPPVFPRVREVADDVYTYEQVHMVGDETITTLSLFVVTPAGVLVADGQDSPDETRRLVEAIGHITDRPITHVVICSDHGDHTSGNSAFPPTAAFLAHPTSAANLERTASAPNRPADAPTVVLPTEVVTEREKILDLGGREIRILHLGRAHTGGDLVVYVPEGDVLFMSETYLDRIFPAMRSAYPSEWLAMIDRALAREADVYVPGHARPDGAGGGGDGLVAYRRAVERVITEVTRLHRLGLSADEAVQRADFGDLEGWSLYASQAPRAVARVYMELDGELVP